ncbi:DUF3427 domain-containing protein [Streptomyces sp. 021-4]|uniref:DUF3427 domain-containing protein n=1 Tax=Streptomyces sp. 021-4 TaxID=2789260 RepID=UPI0039F5D426
MPESRSARALAALTLTLLSDLGDGGEGEAVEILDALLLAAARSTADEPDAGTGRPAPATGRSPAVQPPLPGAGADGPAPTPAPEAAPDDDDDQGASVWLRDACGSHTVPGKPLSMGRVSALPNALDIGRALRPLRRPRPSRVHRRLDIDATVDHYARTGVLLPCLAPAPEPWLEVIVVLDRGTAMAVWDETVHALTEVLRSLSAFQAIHLWYLEHPQDSSPTIRDHQGRSYPMDPAGPHHNQPANRLFLVVSDCAAPAWRRNVLWQTLYAWGLTAPLALINPLPKRLWQRSGLDLPRTIATAAVPAGPGGQLSYRRPRLFRDDIPGTRPWQALPVLQFDPHQIRAWARTLMRTDPAGCEAVLVPASGRVPSRSQPPRSATDLSGTTATDAQVASAATAFTDDVRSPATRLAIAASSLDAFTLPVLDVLRERIVPEATAADTAEFLTANLLTAARQDDSDIVYRFHPVAAEHLRGLLNRDQAWDAHFALTDHLAAHPQAPQGIAAALESAQSQEAWPVGLRPIARAAAATARLLGVGPADPPVVPAAPETPARPVPEDDQEPGVDVAPDSTSAGPAIEAKSAQRRTLERLNDEREIYGRHRNLIVAAVGTGKTAVSALDYRRLRQRHGRDLRLLFLADRADLLRQAQEVYQQVLQDADFGEALHSGAKPRHWNHVFATVQSLTRSMEQLAPDDFDVIVIDEFHHAFSPTYRRILDHFRPLELLGLTATPEHPDGRSVQDEFFEGRIAVEMRLGEALENDMLGPLHYFGIADETDFRPVAWSRGEYDRVALSELLTGDESRARLIVKTVFDKIPDPSAMRGLGFCASVLHAQFMAEIFGRAGFNTIALTATTPSDQRRRAFSSLGEGELHIIFCVGVLGEGLRIPEVDTLLLLHPPSSATAFLQQLGVGLGRAPGKSVLTVLDFIGQHRKEFRFDRQFEALTNVTRRRLVDHIERGFPQLPAGCHISLEEQAKRIIVDNIRGQAEGYITELAREVARYGEADLRRYLKTSGRELHELYRDRGSSWTRLLRRAGLLEGEAPDGEAALLLRVPAFLHVDDPARVDAYTRMLKKGAPLYRELDEQGRAYARMLYFQLWPTGTTPDKNFTSYEEGFAELRQQHAVRNELRQVLQYKRTGRGPASPTGIDAEYRLPLTVHASYHREEILTALGQTHIGGLVPGHFREGVKWCASEKTDILFVTLEKAEREHGAQDRSDDRVLSNRLLRWTSQNQIAENSRTGLRYRNHVEMGTDVLLFVRRRRSNDIGRVEPWTFFGPAEYVEHRGSRPMTITWKLRHEVPADAWSP